MPVCGTCGARRPTTHIRSQRACLSSGGKPRHLASARLTCRGEDLISYPLRNKEDIL